MSIFADEIKKILETEHIAFEEDAAMGRRVFRCRLHCAENPEALKGTRTKAILPMEINSRTPEEAEIEYWKACSAIESITASDGYPLIITQDRWMKDPDSMRLRLLAHLGIFGRIHARSCIVRRITKSEAAGFLGKHHSYGDAACKYRYGLFFPSGTRFCSRQEERQRDRVKERLIAVAEFSNARKWQKGDKVIKSYEWTRYASESGARAVGGMGKLLRAFIEDVAPDDIMSYADLEWSDGKVYETLGFEFESIKSPVLFGVDPATWERKAGPDMTPDGRTLYFKNFGSKKFRLKLTPYV